MDGELRDGAGESLKPPVRLAGPSSGLNYAAAAEAQRRLGDPEAQVVTVFADRMERYFTTELFKPFA